MKRKMKENIKDSKIADKPSKEYTTAELIELGKKGNVLKIAKPLYEDSTNSKEQEN